MHARADEEGVDLLLIDTGDRVEGNGLYDGSEPKGLYTFDIIKEQHIDVICSGNHELYLRNSSENEFYRTVPNFKGNYIASNLDIVNPDTGTLEPLAPRYRRFTTKNQGIRVLAFGFLYDFRNGANNTSVQPVEKTIQEQWFRDAIRERDIDLILVAGHVALDSEEYRNVHKAIREAQWDAPIAFFGGHTHIRDYRKYDSKAYGIESGRYMETIGFLSIDGLSTGEKQKQKPKNDDTHAAAKPRFDRRYIDNNLFSMFHHSHMNHSTFPTPHGQNVSMFITDARKALRLDETFGCAPQNYWVNRSPYPDKHSIFTLLEERILPEQLSKIKRKGKPTIVTTNTGAMRFDIFKGKFTRDTTFLVSPFTSGFRFIEDVPYDIAKQVTNLLNNEGPVTQSIASDLQMLAPPEKVSRQRRSILDASEAITQHVDQVPIQFSDKPLPPGYTTKDDAGTNGDDTFHSPIPYYNVPNCIEALLGFPAKDSKEVPDVVDLVYNEFIQKWVLMALHFLGKRYEEMDTHNFLGEGKSFTEVISDWVSEHWKCEDD